MGGDLNAAKTALNVSVLLILHISIVDPLLASPIVFTFSLFRFQCFLPDLD